MIDIGIFVEKRGVSPDIFVAMKQVGHSEERQP